MKTRVFISFNEGRACYASIKRLLDAGVGCEGLAGPENLLCGLYGRTFDADDPKLGRLRSSLRANGVHWSERVEQLFADAELRTFPFLRLIVDCMPSPGGGTEYGTQYDASSACPRCGTGAVQTSPLLLPLEGLPKRGLLCAAGRGEVLVGEKLRAALERAGITGIELRQTRFHRNGEPLPWWQILARTTMPRMGRATRGIVRSVEPGWGCTQCERDCYFDDAANPCEIVYNTADVDVVALPDVVQTWECFGRSVARDDPEQGLTRGYAQPLLLVKPKVLDILRRLKVQAAKFSPVQVQPANG